ncbi:MAG: hypothetical protein JMN25_14670 [gamma proteobacterium endosymbiont of Lamellibrachia anaximandri]|nr:hypothetical protein [gamma proteobacterium endosymbiont of Lamellibrachia anaximandri]
MINVKVTTRGVKLVSDYLKNLEKQSRFATSVAMNKTVFKVREDVQQEMKRVFDNPTRYTLNSIRYKKSTKANLSADVHIADEAFKGIPPIKWLSPNIFGGVRPLKRSEMHLRRSGLLPTNSYIVPGKGLRRNKFGNVSKGQINKILSNVRAQNDPYQNTPHGRGTSYFSGTIKGTQGIWERRGRKVRPALIYTKRAPKYRSIFEFHTVASKSADKHWPREIEKAIDYAIRTAK